MEFIATTISEHIYHEGLVEGEAKGEARGEALGEINGQIAMLKMVYQVGIVSDEQFQKMIQPLQQKLAELSGTS